MAQNSINDLIQIKYAQFKALALSPIEYKVDSQGRTVRVPNADRPVTEEECIALLKGNRVIDADDALEQVGPNVWKWMIQKGIVRKDSTSSFFWVTAAGADYYKLPQVMGCRFPK